MQDLRSRPARSTLVHLLTFAGALLVPVILFAWVLAWFYVGAEQGRAQERAREAARELMVAMEREVAAPRLVLEGLATSSQLRAGNLGAFYPQASEIARALRLPVIVRAPGERRQLLNTAVPWGAPLGEDDASITDFEQEVLRTKQPVLSDLIWSPVQRIWVAVLIVPVLRSGEVAYFLSVPIPADRLAEVLGQVPLKAGWFAAVTDRRNTIVARSVHHERFVGKVAVTGWASRETGPEGHWAGRTLEGVEVETAYIRSPSTHWTIAVSVPESVLNAPLRRALLLLAAIGLSLLGIAAALAYWTGSGLSRAIESLSEAASAVARGKDVPPIVTPVIEVNAVGQALASAAGQVRKREDHLRSILDTVPSAMIVIDSRGIVQSFSPTAEKVFGYAADEVLGRNVSLLMPESDRGAHDGYMARYLTTGESRIIGRGRIVTGLRKDGSTFPMELNVGAASTHGETVFTGFVRDLTEKQRIEQELRQTQKMEAIGKLTGGVAHDFNNLLTVIIGNLEMLEGKIADHRQKAIIADIQEAADLAADLTSSLLAFGRRMPLAPKRVDVAPLVAGTSELLRRTLGETITVRTVISATCHTLIDPAQLQNALLNLGINARDAMPHGGTLKIEVSCIELDADHAEAYAEVGPGRYVVITMTDTGTGMTKEVQERAFEPFFTTKPVGSGTGLGLSTVYGFVKQSGGHVKLESASGQGTTIRIYLPCSEDGQKATGKQPDSGSALPRARGETILVVEDDARVRRITASRLEELGYAVLEAGSGPEALEVLSRTPTVDLLFTDMVMPGGMSGAELAAQACRSYPNLPVLFTSGYAGPDLVRQAGAKGSSWIKKPYAAGDLAWKLRTVLDPQNR